MLKLFRWVSLSHMRNALHREECVQSFEKCATAFVVCGKSKEESVCAVTTCAVADEQL